MLKRETAETFSIQLNCSELKYMLISHDFTSKKKKIHDFENGLYMLKYQ